MEAIYALTAQFPASEAYVLSAQMRRAAISIPANIAEGQRRGSRRDYRHFLLTAYGSGAELESHLFIAKRLSFSQSLKFEPAESLLNEVMRMLNHLTSSLKD